MIFEELPLLRVTICLEEFDHQAQPIGQPRWVRGFAFVDASAGDEFEAPKFEVRWRRAVDGTYYTISTEDPA